MIYLHKILPVAVSPIGLVVFFCLIAFLFRSRFFLALAILILWLASTPLVSNFATSLTESGQIRQSPDTIENAEAIVVLGGSTNTVRTANASINEWADGDRFFAGLELIRTEKAPKIIFTQAKIPWVPTAETEGAILKRIAMQQGIAEAKIELTGIVQNTADEARETRKLFPADSIPKIILVTSAYHMPRSQNLFKAQGFEVIPYSVDFKTADNEVTILYFLPYAKDLLKTSTSIRELLGRLYYQLI